MRLARFTCRGPHFRPRRRRLPDSSIACPNPVCGGAVSLVLYVSAGRIKHPAVVGRVEKTATAMKLHVTAVPVGMAALRDDLAVVLDPSFGSEIGVFGGIGGMGTGIEKYRDGNHK